MKKILYVLLFSILCVAVQAAETRIAVVDMKKVFQDYEKTKVVEKKLQEQVDMFKEYAVKLDNELQKLQKEFEDARRAAQDNFALSPAERKNKEMKAKELYEKIAVKQTELRSYNTSRQEQIRETYEKLRSEILGEIKQVVRNQAVAQGYDLVLDQSGSTSNEISSVVYYMPKMDITTSVLTDLNRAYQKKDKKK